VPVVPYSNCCLYFLLEVLTILLVLQKTRFYCTVVVTKLSPSQHRWFSACTTCNKGTVPYGPAYKCPDTSCDGTGAILSGAIYHAAYKYYSYYYEDWVLYWDTGLPLIVYKLVISWQYIIELLSKVTSLLVQILYNRFSSHVYIHFLPPHRLYPILPS
jgi:hypothetical protein